MLGIGETASEARAVGSIENDQSNANENLLICKATHELDIGSNRAGESSKGLVIRSDRSPVQDNDRAKTIR